MTCESLGPSSIGAASRWREVAAEIDLTEDVSDDDVEKDEALVGPPAEKRQRTSMTHTTSSKLAEFFKRPLAGQRAARGQSSSTVSQLATSSRSKELSSNASPSIGSSSLPQGCSSSLAGSLHDQSGNPEAISLLAGIMLRGRRSGHEDSGATTGNRSLSSQPLDASIVYLTEDGRSWVIVARNWWPSDASMFAQQWKMHPKEYHTLKIYGRLCHETRYSQSWGTAYKYSGSENKARPLEENPFIEVLLQECNELAPSLGPYNTCLQNWYEPTHAIALHSDDERAHRPGSPIFSLSWGGPRRFILRPKKDAHGAAGGIVAQQQQEIWLHDGDLVVMGGTCQATHKHEVPKVRKKDPVATNRINWTIRAFRTG